MKRTAHPLYERFAMLPSARCGERIGNWRCLDVEFVIEWPLLND